MKTSVLWLFAVSFVPSALSAACLSSANTWQNAPLGALSGSFTAQFTATPAAAKVDGLAGLSNGPASALTNLAAIVRFNSMGLIDARNGGAYAAAAPIPYSPGVPYRFRLAMNTASHSYSAWVTPLGGTERLVGSNFAFRTEQAQTSSLSNLGALADIGSETVCDWTVSSVVPPPPTNAWTNTPFAFQTGTFEARFDAVPGMARMDGIVGLSKGASSSFASLAAAVRFNNAGTIDARNGGTYSAASAIPYVPGLAYRFRLDVNVPARSYSAYVTPQGGPEQALGSNFTFRSEQSAVASLDNMGAFADAGAVLATNLSIAAWSPPVAGGGGGGGAMDRFGVKQLYVTAPGGKEWFSDWANGSARSFRGVDPQDPWFDANHGDASFSVDGRGQFSITGPTPRMYIHDPALSRSWHNVEMTVYAMRVSDDGTAYAGIVGVARTNHGVTASETANLCDTRGLGARMRYDGNVDFDKETSHPNATAVSSKGLYPGGMPRNAWIGYKYAVYDLPTGDVKLEVWRDQTDGAGGGSWVKVNEFVDNGSNMGVGAVACKSGVNPALKLTASDSRQGSESGKPNISVYWRSTNVGANGLVYKKMSVREIVPGATAG